MLDFFFHILALSPEKTAPYITIASMSKEFKQHINAICNKHLILLE